jgi:hypothetical protein
MILISTAPSNMIPTRDFDIVACLAWRCMAVSNMYLFKTTYLLSQFINACPILARRKLSGSKIPIK